LRPVLRLDGAEDDRVRHGALQRERAAGADLRLGRADHQVVVEAHADLQRDLAAPLGRVRPRAPLFIKMGRIDRSREYEPRTKRASPRTTPRASRPTT
jgi:hypothetical protein